jgi:hypothetical protein
MLQGYWIHVSGDVSRSVHSFSDCGKGGRFHLFALCVKLKYVTELRVSFGLFKPLFSLQGTTRLLQLQKNLSECFVVKQTDVFFRIAVWHPLAGI